MNPSGGKHPNSSSSNRSSNRSGVGVDGSARGWMSLSCLRRRCKELGAAGLGPGNRRQRGGRQAKHRGAAGSAATRTPRKVELVMGASGRQNRRPPSLQPFKGECLLLRQQQLLQQQLQWQALVGLARMGEERGRKLLPLPMEHCLPLMTALAAAAAATAMFCGRTPSSKVREELARSSSQLHLLR